MSYSFIPNFLSILRIVLSIFFVLFMYFDTPFFKFLSLLTFFICSLSDFFDGYIARKYKFQTVFGTYLDPIADKVLILSAFITLHFFYAEFIKIWMIASIVLRDLIVTGLRFKILRSGHVMKTSYFSKLKTLFQIILIHIILFLHYFNSDLIFSASIFSFNLVYFLTVFCVFYVIFSGIHYIIINSKYLNEA